MSLPFRVGGVACAIVSVVALSACGSDSGGSSSTASGSSTAAADTASTAKGAPLRVGFICSCSGAQAGALGGTGKVFKAWESSVNAGGGINGHPVKATVKDDAGNPANALRLVKELVQKDKVQALVDASLADGAFEKYVSSSGVPVTGGVSALAPFLTNPDFYPSGGQVLQQTFGALQLAKAAGQKKVGVMYCKESPICAQVVPLTEGIGKLTGLGVVSQAISSTAPSYTAQCLKFKSEGVDALLVASNSDVVQRVTAGCVQQNYKPLTVNLANTASTKWNDDKNLDGALISAPTANYTDPSNPGVKEFLDALDKYASDVKNGSQFTYTTIQAWTGGKLFEAAAKAGKLTPDSTSADVRTGLYALKNETLNGIVPPTTFVKGQQGFPPCYFSFKLTGGKFESQDAGKPVCLKPAEIKALTTPPG